MKKKGFTLIELLVVIAIIAMLLAILMPALSKVKKMAQRLICGTNLKGMGTALYVYAFDYRDEFPVAGGKGVNNWAATTVGWNNPAWLWNDTSVIDTLTISASLYMLLREADVGPKSFVCKSSDEQPFINEEPFDITELWDFTADPKNHQSYAYQQPYVVEGKSFPADGTSNPGNAIMADQNPWYDDKLIRDMSNTLASGQDFLGYVALISNWELSSSDWQIKVANSRVHDRVGQNVLFGDGHVFFEKRPDVGTRYDNIYTVKYFGTTSDSDDARRIGYPKFAVTSDPGGLFAISSEDSVLANDEVYVP